MRDLKWQLLILSSGEKAIFQLASEADVSRLKGEEVRLIDVPAIADEQLGIYERLPTDFNTPANLSDSIAAECATNHGIAFRHFIGHVSTQWNEVARLTRAEMDLFMKAAEVPQDGWERRFGQRFALAFAAGALAGKWGIVPWNREMVGQQIRTCYRAARARVPDADQLRTAGLIQLRGKLSGDAQVLDLFRSGHHVHWTQNEVEAADAFRRSGPGGTHFLVSPEVFATWFVSQLQANLVLDELDRLNCLIKPHPSLRTVQVAIKGVNVRRRYYAIRETILNSA